MIIPAVDWINFVENGNILPFNQFHFLDRQILSDIQHVINGCFEKTTMDKYTTRNNEELCIYP